MVQYITLQSLFYMTAGRAELATNQIFCQWGSMHFWTAVNIRKSEFWIYSLYLKKALKIICGVGVFHWVA